MPLNKITEWNDGNLPTYKECKRILENHQYRQDNSIVTVVDEEPIPTALHNFIYEQEPAHPNDVVYFREGLISVLNEVGDLGEFKGQIFNPAL